MLIVDLVTQIEDFTINLGLELIAPDDFDDILCVRLQLDHARLLSLRIHRNSRHQVHGGSPRGFPLGSRATIMPARTRLRLFRRRAWAAISGQAAHGPPAANATLLMRTRTVFGERSKNSAGNVSRRFELADAAVNRA